MGFFIPWVITLKFREFAAWPWALTLVLCFGNPTLLFFGQVIFSRVKWFSPLRVGSKLYVGSFGFILNGYEDFASNIIDSWSHFIPRTPSPPKKTFPKLYCRQAKVPEAWGERLASGPRRESLRHSCIGCWWLSFGSLGTFHPHEGCYTLD